MKQSSIDWLKHALEEYGDQEKLEITWKDFDELIRYAKAMHKEEIEDAYISNSVIRTRSKAEQYYNETFNTKEK